MNKRPKHRVLTIRPNSSVSAYSLQKVAEKTDDQRPIAVVGQDLSLRYQMAFTLTELLTTMALIGILTSLAVPSMQQMQRQYERIKTERLTQQLLQEGRNTAFSLRQRIIVCGSRQGDACDAADWARGMLMFHDVNLDNIYTPEVDVALRFEPLNLKYGTWRWVGGAKFTSFVRFEQTSGMPHASFGSFHYCDFEQAHFFKLVMRNTGVLRKDNTDVNC